MTLILDENDRLPAGDPHPATLDEIYALFVEQAPFRRRREKIYTALELFIHQVWEISPQAYFWVDGGFTTHKQWGAPEDADVVAFVPVEEIDLFRTDKKVPLHSLLGVKSQSITGSYTEKLHSYGGLMDTFIVPDTGPHRETWDNRWSKVRGPNREEIPGARKGYVEVNRHG